MKIDAGRSVCRGFTTLGTGGPARAFARPETRRRARRRRSLCAAADGSPVARRRARLEPARRRRGLRRALALKLGGELAQAEVDGELLVAGGGAPNAVCPAPRAQPRARRLRVRLRDPRHRRRRRLDERRRLRRRLARASSSARSSSTADGADWRTPDELGLATGTPTSSTARSSRASSSGSTPAPPDEIKAIVADLQAQRKAAQPTNKRTFGSVFKNPEHELSAGRMLEAVRPEGPPRSAARRSRPGTRTSSRTPTARSRRTRSR